MDKHLEDLSIESMEKSVKGNINNSINSNWVIPEKVAPPESVFERYHKFKLNITELSNSGKLTQDKFREILSEYIFEKKITPKEIKALSPLNKKGLGKLVKLVYDRFKGSDFIYTYYLLNNAGFLMGSILTSGFAPKAMILPPEFIIKKNKLMKEYQERVKKYGKDDMDTIVWVDKEMDKMIQEVAEYFRKNGIDVVNITDAGARGSLADIRKILVGIGLSINTKGEINDVILNSHSEGLEQTQYFNYSSQAVQALYSKSSDTAIPGYLARKLSTVAEPIQLSKLEDCGTKEYLSYNITDIKMLEALDGRTLKNGKQIDASNEKEMKKLLNTRIEVRSPLYCKAKDGICWTCYNKKVVKEMKLFPGYKIALHAATYTGSNRLVNLTLKKSHVGLSLGVEKVNMEEDLFKFSE